LHREGKRDGFPALVSALARQPLVAAQKFAHQFTKVSTVQAVSTSLVSRMRTSQMHAEEVVAAVMQCASRCSWAGYDASALACGNYGSGQG